jgi:hypothetical protein
MHRLMDAIVNAGLCDSGANSPIAKRRMVRELVRECREIAQAKIWRAKTIEALLWKLKLPFSIFYS